MQNLHRGESEAIILADELHADYLLMDEAAGRKTAEAMGVKIIGLLGVLLEAKREHLLLQVKPVSDDLMKMAKFRVRESLYEQIVARCYGCGSAARRGGAAEPCLPHAAF